MVILFSKPMTNILYNYLNRKYLERAGKERGYTVRKFSEEVGIKEGTMLRLLNKDTDVKGIRIEHLQKIAQHFGPEFLRELKLLKD